MSLGKRGMFGEAKSKTLSDIVKIDTLPNAEKSVLELQKRFSTLKRRHAKVKTKRATVLVANRAAIIAKNTKNPKMKSEKLRISGIYRKAASKMVLKELYKEE